MFNGLPGAVQRMLNSAQSVSVLLTHSCNLTSHGLKGKQNKAEAEEDYMEEESVHAGLQVFKYTVLFVLI